jgi:hypothetical protein
MEGLVARDSGQARRGGGTRGGGGRGAREPCETGARMCGQAWVSCHFLCWAPSRWQVCPHSSVVRPAGVIQADSSCTKRQRAAG